jgi:hypothetical protein
VKPRPHLPCQGLAYGARRLARMLPLPPIASECLTAFGPLPGEKLVLTNTKKAVLTSSGETILANAASADPLSELILKAALAQAKHAGDGTKAFIIMLSAASTELEFRRGRVPIDRQRAWKARLGRAFSWLAKELPDVLGAHWHAQARCTSISDAFSLRHDAACVVSTALGGHLGESTSVLLASAVVDAIFPSSCEGEELAVVARERSLRPEDGGVTVVHAGGALADRSCAMDGRTIEGRPACETMPRRGAKCGLLLLALHAAPPEMMTEAEARAAGVPAHVELTIGGGGGRSADHGAARCSAATGSDSAACVLAEAVRVERVRWADELAAAGVGLLLSGAPLGALVTQVCAERGICAIQGVDVSDLRSLCIASGKSALQRWPRSAELPLLLEHTSGFRIEGCSFEMWPLAGRSHVCIRLEGAPRLSSLLVRAPSDALAKEYAAAATRALNCLRLWLQPEASGGAIGAGAGTGAGLLSLPGGGSAEMQLEAAVRKLAPTRGLPAEAEALEVLASSLSAIPRRLHENAVRASALAAHANRWPVLLQQLRAAHGQDGRCALGLVVRGRKESQRDGDLRLLEVSDAFDAGILEPLSLKLALVDRVLCSLAQLLSLDPDCAAAVRHSSFSRRCGDGGTRRRRRHDGCSSDDTEESGEDGSESDGHGGGTTSEDHGEDAVVVVEVEDGVQVQRRDRHAQGPHAAC